MRTSLTGNQYNQIFKTLKSKLNQFIKRYDNLSDNHLRTAITIRITEKFPKESKEDTTRNKIKDTLLQIIKYSKTQDSGNLLTFVDLFD